MSISIKKINNTKQKHFIQQLSFSKQIFPKNRQQKLGSSTFLDKVLSLDKLTSFFIQNVWSTIIISIIVSIPLIHW